MWRHVLVFTALIAAACGDRSVVAAFERDTGTELFVVVRDDAPVRAEVTALPATSALRFALEPPTDGLRFYALYYDRTPDRLGMPVGALSLAEGGRPVPAPVATFELNPDEAEPAWSAIAMPPPSLDSLRVPGPDCAVLDAEPVDVPLRAFLNALPDIIVPTEAGVLVVSEENLFHIADRTVTSLPETTFTRGTVGDDGTAWITDDVHLFSARATPDGFADVTMTATIAGGERPVRIHARRGEVFVGDDEGGVYELRGDQLVEVAQLGDYVREIGRLGPEGPLVVRSDAGFFFIDGGAPQRQLDEPDLVFVDRADRLIAAFANDIRIRRDDGRFDPLLDESSPFSVLEIRDFDGGLAYLTTEGKLAEIRGELPCPAVQVVPGIAAFGEVEVSGETVYGAMLRSGAEMIDGFRVKVVSR